MYLKSVMNFLSNKTTIISCTINFPPRDVFIPCIYAFECSESCDSSLLTVQWHWVWFRSIEEVNSEQIFSKNKEKHEKLKETKNERKTVSIVFRWKTQANKHFRREKGSTENCRNNSRAFLGRGRNSCYWAQWINIKTYSGPFEFNDISNYDFQVTENDHLPKSICRDCWNKLDSFHRFYETVNEAKHKFLANFVKVEAMNFVEIDCDGIESDRKAPLVKDEVIDFGQTEIRSPSLKNKAVCSGQFERLGNNSKHSSDANTIPNHIIDTQPASYRCDENLDEEVTMNVPCVESVEETAASAIDTSIAAAKSMVEENKTNDHLIANYIDMNCDLCKMPFNSLSDAISHYRNNHNKYTALLRCCQRRIQTSYIRDHVRYHLNPDIFK